MNNSIRDNLVKCYHCGEVCLGGPVKYEQKNFCCEGCKLVYELLEDNGLCTYYDLNKSPGHKNANTPSQFSYLDQVEIREKLISYREKERVHVSFRIPSIHCSSCIWLLENLHTIHSGVVQVSVDFLRRKARIIYNEKEISLSSLVSLLSTIGYEPSLQLSDLNGKSPKKTDRSMLIKIGVAGFGFGNIMMLSFPEYFSSGNFYEQPQLKHFFGLLNILLALPVFFYSASGFFKSSLNGIRSRFLNIDIPISFAIVVTFSRSLYEILSGTGAGYLDSMTGIVFFMLLGRYFQELTYNGLSFDRDYKSYFPIAVTVKSGFQENSVPVSKLMPGDIFIARNKEVIPVDGTLLSDKTYIDYSFVTGESRPVKKLKGERIYAGGRQLDGIIELKVEKKLEQGYLTSLWNKDSIEKDDERSSFIHGLGGGFTYVVLGIALSSFIFWFVAGNPSRGLDAMTAVLIVACPCALLLSSTFTNGNVLRILSRNGFYLKNSEIIEKLCSIDTILFDKTGTLTEGSDILYLGEALSEKERELVGTLARNSLHPLSRKIAELFSPGLNMKVKDFEEFPGLGIKGWIDGNCIALGSRMFVTGSSVTTKKSATVVYLMINGSQPGQFRIRSIYRKGIAELMNRIKNKFQIGLISGDNDSDKEFLKTIFAPDASLYFNQLPGDKSEYIAQLQKEGKKVAMVGDGLNDGVALSKSDVGIAVTNGTNTFTPACDALLEGKSVEKLDSFFEFVKSGKKLIVFTFVFSIVYNLIGLIFAVQGILSPVVAAILMPASSLSIILISVIATRIIARKKGLVSG